jgi:tripartite-type tricarboxylate transporter receptor subunit TctC
VTPALSKLTYDGIKDFAPVAMVANVPNVLVVRASLPVKSVPELVALAKSKPGTLNYGSVGNGSQPHLAAEMFKQMTGTDLTHLPYKGAAPAITDLLGEQIDLAFLNAPPLLPHIQSGKLRALAVTTMKRARQLPDVPTLNELGLTGFDVSTWYGISAPAATPKPVVEKLTAVVSKVLTSPDVSSKLTSQGAEIFLLPGKEFSNYLQEDAARLTKLIKSANIKED